MAEYVTELPPREVLGQKLHAAIAAARTRVDVLPPEIATGDPAEEPPP